MADPDQSKRYERRISEESTNLRRVPSLGTSLWLGLWYGIHDRPPFVFGQEFRVLIGEIRQHKEGVDSTEDSGYAFDDEKPPC